MKASDFVGELFLARDVAHSVHLATRSYAKHMALDAFYHDIVGLADSFAETYQGYKGLIGPISLQSARKTTNITEFLQDSLDTIQKMRYKICDKESTALQNIVDEIESLYLSTLYKLKFLA